MLTIPIPYHNTSLPLHIDEANLVDVLRPAGGSAPADRSGADIVRAALRSPIGSPPLRELAKGRERVVIVTSDHTRAMPSRVTLPLLLAEIREGNPDARISILIATGLHRPTTVEEQRSMFGDDIVDRETIAVNDAHDEAAFTRICTLPSGAEFWVNSIATDCDLLITEGFIEPHFFAGFSGGRKSILPGICNKTTINENHSYKAVSHRRAAAGVLEGNPIHDDMLFAARAVNVAFILNVALDEDKRISAAFAGELEEAHAAGVEFVRRCAGTPVQTADIVITSNGGYPLDQNLYQSPKAAATAEACAGEDGVIILCCSCCDGIGGSYFEKLVTSGTPEEIDRRLSSIAPKETIPEQWCAQIFARMLMKHKIILVSGFLDPDYVRRANMIPAATPDEALETAYGIKGRDARVLVIPDGVSVLIEQ